jgi:hypothetical protein
MTLHFLLGFGGNGSSSPFSALFFCGLLHLLSLDLLELCLGLGLGDPFPFALLSLLFLARLTLPLLP